MTTKVIVHGSKALGVRMHQWHSGMDAIYGVGSLWYAGRPADLAQVERALSLLEGVPRTGLAPEDRRELKSLISDVKSAIAEAEEDECDSCKHGTGPCEKGKDKGRRSSGKPEAVHAEARKKLLAKLEAVRSKVPGFDQVARDVRDATVPIQTIYLKVKSACAGRDAQFVSMVCGPFEEYLVAVGEAASGELAPSGSTQQRRMTRQPSLAQDLFDFIQYAALKGDVSSLQSVEWLASNLRDRRPLPRDLVGDAMLELSRFQSHTKSAQLRQDADRLRARLRHELSSKAAGSSGKLYAHAGERSANRYYPVKTHDGSLIVVAAQSMANEDEVLSIGMPFAAEGDGLFFESQQAAKKSIFNRLKAEGDPKPGRAFGARVTHADPRDLVKPSSGLTSGKKALSAPSVPRAELPAPPASPAASGRAMTGGYEAGLREGPSVVVVALQPYGVRLEDSDEPGVRVMVDHAITDAARNRAAQSALRADLREQFIEEWKRGAREALSRHGASGAIGDGAPMSTKKKVAVGLMVTGAVLGAGALVVRSMQPASPPPRGV